MVRISVQARLVSTAIIAISINATARAELSCADIMSAVRDFSPTPAQCEALYDWTDAVEKKCKPDLSRFEKHLWKAVARCPMQSVENGDLCQQAEKSPRLIRILRINRHCPLELEARTVSGTSSSPPEATIEK